MGSQLEGRFYRKVHDLLPKELHREKMHNPYSCGTPDVWYSGTGDDLWVEYKYMREPPKRADINVKKLLSPMQLRWLKHRHAEGRNVVVILGSPAGCWVYEHLEWEKPLPAAELRTMAHGPDYIANYIWRRTMLDVD